MSAPAHAGAAGAPRKRRYPVRPPNADSYALINDPEHQRLSAQVGDMAAQMNQTALILERLSTRFDALEEEHDRRISALEARPREAREARLGERNLSTQVWLVGCGILTVLAYLLPHLSFH